MIRDIIPGIGIRNIPVSISSASFSVPVPPWHPLSFFLNKKRSGTCEKSLSVIQ